MLPFASDAMAGELAAIIGATFLVVGAPIWFIALIRHRRYDLKELGQGLALLGSILVSVSIIIVYWSLILALALTVMALLVTLVWVVKSLRLLAAIPTVKENEQNSIDYAREDQQTESAYYDPFKSGVDGKSKPVHLIKIDVRIAGGPAFVLLAVATGVAIGAWLRGHKQAAVRRALCPTRP